ncbi:RNA polymerase sigma factor SigJ [Glycomyces salinus]|uniref:RNA polymerase sigma factor SigJ n=1 Tax=Glycomyces salinus TaxID=980294 RepID=UPI0018ED3597|nr:RNA polymerase sigma factor SigJ [Glycomyces salinus]
MASEREADRGLLLNVAYRMLGSVAEAEDAVQEAYARWFAMDPGRRDAVERPTAWLVTTVGRVCLDVLGSARHRRVRYVGPWLPEPVSGSASWTSRAGAQRAQDPAELVSLDESLGFAMLVVLESMTPAERVAFVLHDVFGYPFDDIAAIVGRSNAACRRLASSARRRVREGRRREVAGPEAGRAVEALKSAWRTGDPDALIALLDPEAAAVADGGGKVTATLHPVRRAANVAALLLGVRRREPGLTLESAEVNAGPGLVARDRDGRVAAVVAVDCDRGTVHRLWVMRNPDKLSMWR